MFAREVETQTETITKRHTLQSANDLLEIKLGMIEEQIHVLATMLSPVLAGPVPKTGTPICEAGNDSPAITNLLRTAERADSIISDLADVIERVQV